MRRRSGDVYAASSPRFKEERNRQEAAHNPIQQQQAELLRKLDSFKGHLLRNDQPKVSHQTPMGFHAPPNYYPYPMYHPSSSHAFPMHQSFYPQGQYVDISPDPRFFPSRYSDVSLISRVHTRWPSETGAPPSHTDSRRCHPLAGGAPFIACYNCFELLYLPKKKLLSQEKLQCGACSEVFSFTIADKKLVFSSSALEEDSVQVEDRSADCPLKDEETKTVPSEHSDDTSISSEAQKEVVKSVRRRVKVDPENSNLLELFEYSNVNRAALSYGMSELGYNKQDSLKPESADQTHVSEDSSSEVWVNGHLIPEDQVRSAEKQAGPVQAGNYWYDYRAGFWGVMGNPCLGIIPPFIEEFSRPMPDKCGAGNTRVFVNGRELHQRDLLLLSRRGLPPAINRSYIVDISGRVLDGDSGEELKCLGHLAPTIDKVKHGFGMRVPTYLPS